MKRVQYVMKGTVCDEAYIHGLNTMNWMKGRVWDDMWKVDRKTKQSAL